MEAPFGLFCRFGLRHLKTDVLTEQRQLDRLNLPYEAFEVLQQGNKAVRVIKRQTREFRQMGFDLRHSLFQVTHFLGRSFGSTGRSRLALGARPVGTITPKKLSRNLKMETAMSGTRRLIPERAEVISAYRKVTHPEDFLNEPNLHQQMQHAWQVLLADRRMRIEAKRAAAAIRSIFPGDAA